MAGRRVMTRGVRRWLAGAAAIVATLVPGQADAKPCMSNGDCMTGAPQTPICSGSVCVECTSSFQCLGPGTDGPNCDLVGPMTMGTCFNCNSTMNGPACPPSAPACDSVLGLCVPGSAPDAGGPDAVAGSDAGDSGGSRDADAGKPAGDASTGPGDAASDAQSAMDATPTLADGSSASTGDPGSSGLIEGGACSCDLPGDARRGSGAAGLAFAMTLLAWRWWRRSTT